MEVFSFLITLFNRGEIVTALGGAAVVAVGMAAKNSDWFRRAEKGNETVDRVAIGKLSEKVVAIDNRLKRVETDIDHLPTRSEFHAVALQLVTLEGKVNTVERTATATGHAVGRIEEHMLAISRGR